MLTFFTTPKPFIGHAGLIQRNALHSWKRLHPDVEVILFGDEVGAAEACAECEIVHEPNVKRHESGLPYIDYLFARAQKIARNDYLCYSNCDMIFLEDFWEVFERARCWRNRLLIVGRRWDTDVVSPIDFSYPDWATNLRRLALTKGFLQHPGYLDYFLFSKGLYDHVPPLLVGRSYWDQWTVWKALSNGVGVLDCSPFVVAVHQNHDYAYHPDGKRGTDRDELAMRNRALSGKGRHLRSVLDATHRITRNGDIRRNFVRRFFRSMPLARVEYVRTLLEMRERYQRIVNKTFHFRSRIGLRRETLRRLLGYQRQSPR